jgi:2,3-diaminopropionate biosynthesis protein SbnA
VTSAAMLPRSRFAVADIGDTPVLQVGLRVAGRQRRLWLKLEQFNPGGSIKDRTAYGIVNSLVMSGRLTPGATVVESTSGNLGIALAYLAREWDFAFVAVLDPKVSPPVLALLESLGATVECVDDPRGPGFYLRRRLERVHDLLAENPGYIWTNQYGNPANPGIHFEQTGPEIRRQFARPPDAVFVAVSTGGTLAGIGRYFKIAWPAVRVIGVDVAGSGAFGGPPGRWQLNGIGSGLCSKFLRPAHYDAAVFVEDEQAVAACYALAEQAGLALGGSSGAVVAGCLRYLAQHPEIREAVCVCPDGGERYGQTIYDQAWLARHGLDVAAAAGRLQFDITDIVGFG